MCSCFPASIIRHVYCYGVRIVVGDMAFGSWVCVCGSVICIDAGGVGEGVDSMGPVHLSSSLLACELTALLSPRITKMRENCLQQFDAHWNCAAQPGELNGR